MHTTYIIKTIRSSRTNTNAAYKMFTMKLLAEKTTGEFLGVSRQGDDNALKSTSNTAISRQLFRDIFLLSFETSMCIGGDGVHLCLLKVQLAWSFLCVNIVPRPQHAQQHSQTKAIVEASQLRVCNVPAYQPFVEPFGPSSPFTPSLPPAPALQNKCFITCIDSVFKYKIQELGGVRVITH